MIYVISTYPPKACGIAIFSQNFIRSLTNRLTSKNKLAKSSKSNKKEEVGVLAMIDEGRKDLEYGREVVYKINKNDQQEYLQAADYININKPRICVVEHEFGIYGGENGHYILSFINRVQVRMVVVFHTILQNPSKQQRLIISELAKHSLKVVVMSEFGIDYLKKIYGVDPDKITYIPHGVPHFSKSTINGPLSQRRQVERSKKSSGRLLVTFGLLSRNKGLETAIMAMKDIVKSFPDTQYLIIGKTHPEVVKLNGEEYRNYLNSLVVKNHLQKHVLFINSFLSEEQIIDYVMSADLYVTPYQDPNQITSGTLSYAIGSGIPFISTPYRYAEEKAQYGCGRLFPFHGAQEMAQVVKEIFDSPNILNKMRKKCQEVRKAMGWNVVAEEYLKLFYALEKETQTLSQTDDEIFKDNLSWMPLMKLSHVYRLTDSTGIIQHARYAVPRFSDGYCVDDNARAIILMVMAYRVKKDPLFIEKLNIYLAFIDYMINKNGTIRNFMSFDRRFLDEVGSDDCYGRTLWALGYLIAFPTSEYSKEIGEDLYALMRQHLPHFAMKGSLRGIANAIIGSSYYLIANSGDADLITYLRKMADRLLNAYKKSRHNDWEWFEEKMSYDNALLPLALIRAYEYLGDKEYLDVGIITSKFLKQAMLVDDYYQPIGNSDWYYREHDHPSKYDQQPIEIMSLNWFNFHAFRVTKNVDYLKDIRSAFRWFLGDNSLGIHLYDYETNGCADGLQEEGANRNQGAESTLAFWISYCLVLLSTELEV